MGFDPRSWSSSAPRDSRRVTSNIDAVLAENQALRREVQQLRRRLLQLEQLAQTRQRRPWPEPEPARTPRVTAEQVKRWGEALAQQSSWKELRLGGDGLGLQGLIDELNRRSFNPELSLAQRLDRLAPGLGADLAAAVAGPLTKKRAAVLAAFALYGVSALEWLDEIGRAHV